MSSSEFKVGNWVEVRGKEEILRTLDGNGQLDGMPFMPEMFQLCGSRFQVYKSAHKTCDPNLFTRRIERAVHLDTRCNGQAHGGCQAACLFYWKDAWLKPVSENSPGGLVGIDAPVRGAAEPRPEGCTEEDVWRGVKKPCEDTAAPTWVCQITQVPAAGRLLPWWDIRQYLQDYWSGNVSFWRLLSALVYSGYYHLSNAGIGVGRAMRWFYDTAYRLWRGTPWPRKTGEIPEGQPTPAESLNLQPGELVRVKSYEEILRTVNTGSRNRGLWWDAELVPYCGRTYRVLSRVADVIDEKTGKMQHMKTPCIILDSVICLARYSACRMLCPKSTYAYWREIWLERVGLQNSAPPACSDEALKDAAGIER